MVDLLTNKRTRQIIAIEDAKTTKGNIRIRGLAFGNNGNYTLAIFLYDDDTFETTLDTIIEETIHIAIYKCNIKVHHHWVVDRLRAIGAMNPNGRRNVYGKNK